MGAIHSASGVPDRQVLRAPTRSKGREGAWGVWAKFKYDCYDLLSLELINIASDLGLHSSSVLDGRTTHPRSYLRLENENYSDCEILQVLVE